MSQLYERLQSAALFQGLPSALVEAVLARSTTRELSDGQVLLRAGDDNDDLCLIVSGGLAVHVASPERPYVHLSVGDCVGELSVIDRSRVSADVVATASTVVLAIDRAQVWALIESSAEAARNLLKILTGRVRHDNVVLAESDRLQLELEQIAMIDVTTGLRNRRWLDAAFARQLSRTLRVGQPVSLLMIDLDDFKRINDVHGHVTGDAVLRHTARRIADALRPQDLVARYGGDEFAVLLPNADAEQALALAERLRVLVADTHLDGTRASMLPVTISVGVAALGDHDSLPDLVAAADAALYRAKDAGRDRVSA